MQFTKYSSIENSYRDKYVNAIIEQGYGNEEFVVLSKTDGANFSFICDGETVKVASRNNVIDDTFFNCQSVVVKYRDLVLKLFNYLHGKFNKFSYLELVSIQLYGELIVDGINNRVRYCKDREFIVFDLLITTTAHSYYCDYNFLVDLVEHFNLFNLTPEHYRGNLQDCLEYCTNNQTFKSLVSELLDNKYKELEVNNEEGYVVRPIKYLTLKAGDRVILKCKSPEFKENSNKSKPPAKLIELTEEENEVLNKLSELVTESRVYSVTSKLGKLSPNDFGKVLGLFVKDIIEDYSKDNELVINKTVNKQLNKLCSNCIRNIRLNILDAN